MSRGAVVGVVVIAALVALVGGGGLWYSKMRQGADAGGMPEGFEMPEAVQVVPARETQWQQTADLVGTVIAMRSVMVRNELAGVVRSVGFDSGTVVDTEQIILTQDDSLERADLSAAQANVRVAEANIRSADSRIELAQLEVSRLTAAVQERAVVAMELDRARTEVATAEADRERWVAEADQSKARVAQVEARLAKLVIRAPFKARAGIRNVHEGQYLAEGADVVALQEVTDRIYLDFAIPQEYAARAQPGVVVMATGELLGPEPVPIEVVAADATVNFDTRNLRVRAVVDNKQGLLVPGMSVQVRVPLEAPQPSVVVPNMAVRRAAYGNSVFVIAPDEQGKTRARQRFVTLGRTLGEEVIVADGLKVGERVAGAGSFKLRDGVLVMEGPPGGAPGGPPGANAGAGPAASGG